MPKRVPTRFARRSDPVELATRFTLIGTAPVQDVPTFRRALDARGQIRRHLVRRYGKAAAKQYTKEALETYRILSGG